MRDINDDNEKGELAWKNRVMIAGVAGLRQTLAQEDEGGEEDAAGTAPGSAPQLDGFGSFDGDAEMESVLAMRAHYQRTLEMAQMEMTTATDPQLRAIAQNVVAAKSREIAQLDLWLDAHRSGQAGIGDA